MKIKREELLNELHLFAQRGSGVVIGQPGIGKSRTLFELSQFLISKNVRTLLLPIDKLGKGTQKDFKEVLEINEDLIDFLKNEKTDESKGILIFDAFDAARNEEVRSRYLNLIRRANSYLRENWHILVSVRSYDAQHSQELLDIFDTQLANDNPDYYEVNFDSRHFLIPILNQSELEQAFVQIANLKNIYESASDELQNILRVPFNLWLMEKLLKGNQNLDFSPVRSETQLLELFWQRKIWSKDNKEEREILLKKATQGMVKNCALSESVDNIFSQKLRVVWKELLSDEVIEEVGFNKRKITFTHNILFDFAVSVLLLDDDIESLLSFLQKDLSRIFFLRPSLTYYMTRYWYKDQTYFWQLLEKLYKSTDQHILLFARTVPIAVIAREARVIEDLSPLNELLKSDQLIASRIIVDTIRSLNTLGSGKKKLWLDFYFYLSKKVNDEFVWDLTTSLAELFDTSFGIENKSLFAKISQNLLRWTWTQKELEETKRFDSLIAHRLIPLVSKTFSTDIKNSEKLLRPILSEVGKENFTINFLYKLADNINSIWPYSPEFVEDIYETTFSYSEKSQESTNFGSYVMPMTSTRRQEYEMCFYLLVRGYKDFLEGNPHSATRALVRSLNAFVIDEHILKYLKEAKTLKDAEIEFIFNKRHIKIFNDFSYIWDSSSRTHVDRPIEICDLFFDYLGKLIPKEKNKSLELIDIIVEESKVAFFWKRLLQIASEHPSVLSDYFFEALILKPLQTSTDTTYELGKLLEATIPYISVKKIAEVEKSLVSLGKASEPDHKDIFIDIQKRLFSCFPSSKLSTDTGKKIKKETEKKPEVYTNKPLYEFQASNAVDVNADWFLKNKGVDINGSQFKKFKVFFEPLNTFIDACRNKVPDFQESEKILPTLKQLVKVTQTEKSLPDLLDQEAWTKIASVSSLVARNSEAKKIHKGFLKKTLIKAANHSYPKFDSEYEKQHTTPSWSPSPRTEAVEGLAFLVTNSYDKKVIDTIEELSTDRVSSVRFLMASNLYRFSKSAPGRFRDISFKLAEEEEKEIVINSFVRSLYNGIVARNTKFTEKILRTLYSRSNKKSDFSSSITPLMVGMAVVKDNEWCKERIISFIDNPIRYHLWLEKTVSGLLDFVTSDNLQNTEGLKKLRYSKDLLVKMIPIVVKNLDKTIEEKPTVARNLYEAIDNIITRLFFNSGIKGDVQLSPEIQKQYYFEVRPILNEIILNYPEESSSVILAPTAHYFMELLNGCLKYDPKGVIFMASRLVRNSERAGYNLDSLAIREVVEISEKLLADHRQELREANSLADFVTLLDTFAKTGWPEAIKLLWRLDEVFR